MKEKVIEAAGKAWQFLGQNGETELNALAKRLKEKNEVALQSLGWLAREDKISYSQRDKKIFVSLVESEAQIFNSIMKSMQADLQQAHNKKGRVAKRI